ncbi:MAG: hypothetical protein FWD69_15250 [Polyangiaceae bacterium]|nr:hypothetical protein [Polyangiaceae bacterium]
MNPRRDCGDYLLMPGIPTKLAGIAKQHRISHYWGQLKMRKPTTINLDPETRTRLERARDRHALGKCKPSLSDIANEAMVRGLPSLLGERDASEPPIR